MTKLKSNTKTKKPIKKSKVDITIVLDRSGSMGSIKSDVIGGYNSFIAEQKKTLKGMDVRIGLVQFDDIYENVYEGKKLSDVEDLTSAIYVPRGTTALLDAIGKTITSIEDRISKEKVKTDLVIVAVMTDGEENSSEEYSRDVIFSLIEGKKAKKRGKAKWQFVFLGANQDAIKNGGTMGFDKNASLSLGNGGQSIIRAMTSLSTHVGACVVDPTLDFSFSQADRDLQKN